MRLFRPLLVVLCLTLLAPLEVSAAEGRVALVIGNAGYKESPLRNPVNDSRAIAAALRQLNFDVIEVENATNKAMQMAVMMFARKMGPDVTSLFYYAGHGVQFDGNNYLVPLGAELDSELSFEFEALNVGNVIKAMERSGSRLNLVILDACRNNPFGRRLRGQSRGLAAIDAATGTLIAYATAPGSVAADGDGKNGLYTEALLNALEQPGLQVEEMFKQVRIEVSERSNGQQVPWESSSLTGDFVFRLEKTDSDKSVETVAPKSPASQEAELLYWESIKDSGVAVLYQAYLDKFPDGIFIAIARHKLEQLDDGATTSLEVEVTESDEEEEQENEVVLLLASAQESLSALRLTTPEGNNAFDQFSEVLGLDPGNVEAQSGLAQIADKYIGLANRAAERGDLEGAEVYLEQAKGVTPGSESIAYAQESIEVQVEKARVLEEAARVAEERQRKAEEETKRLAEEKKRKAVGDANIQLDGIWQGRARTYQLDNSPGCLTFMLHVKIQEQTVNVTAYAQDSVSGDPNHSNGTGTVDADGNIQATLNAARGGGVFSLGGVYQLDTRNLHGTMRSKYCEGMWQLSRIGN